VSKKIKIEYPNWFEQTALGNFELYLADYADKPDLKFLQIGAFTGDASLWMLNNILTHPSSRLTDVDTWEGSDEEVHKAMDFDDVRKTYQEKVLKHPNLGLVYPMTSMEFFKTNEDKYDFIYIDGDHTASGVIDDAVMAWQVLKPGGIMAFDDYTWVHIDGILHSPHEAINFFTWAKQGQFQLIAVNNQVWLLKNDN